MEYSVTTLPANVKLQNKFQIFQMDPANYITIKRSSSFIKTFFWGGKIDPSFYVDFNLSIIKC